MVLIHIAIVLLKLENQVMLAGSYAANSKLNQISVRK